MTARGQQPEELFHKALSITDSSERARFLVQACGEDAALRTEVENLVKWHEQANSFLESPPAGAQVTSDGAFVSEGAGTRIGHYELIQEIGQGGMGLVYLAEQKEPVRRRVALKIIKPGMDSREVIARFEAERQALALLDHPNIAHVLDAGATETGRPYFVMEYVRGLPITQYCDQNKLGIEQRLRLFEQVCEAIQHAHQKGIIHRDLKPSNILVSLHGDRAEPKIIDFGVAKAITQPLTSKTCATLQGELLGTPEYMSPEQVDLATQDIDTRSDIYSLGVVLYELLAGVVPFERESLARLGLAEIQRTIREQEPVSPSTRLTLLGDKARPIAASRSTQSVALARRLRRELEWIPLKAMRKDRCRRYRSAHEMADDIRNYLSGLPLIAGPETTIYRVRKFVRKHAGSVATVALVAVAILLGLAASTMMYYRAETARREETKSRTVAQEAERTAHEAEKTAEAAEKTAQEQRDRAASEAERASQQAESYRRSLYFNKIALAQANQQNGEVRSAREFLSSCPEDLRGWEWYYLWGTSDQSELTLRGHDNSVVLVAVSMDGRRIVSVSKDGTARVWDSTTGREFNNKRLEAGSLSVTSAAISHDAQRVAVGLKDGTIRVWCLEDGEEEPVLRGPPVTTAAIAFDREGKRLVSGSSDGKVKLWDIASGRELASVETNIASMSGLWLNPDGTHVAVRTTKDTAIRIWDIAAARESVMLRGHSARVNSVAYSPDGKRVVCASNDSTVRIWDALNGAAISTLRGHTRAVNCAVFSPDGNRIASCGSDRSVRIWNATSGAEVRTLLGHESEVTWAAFSMDGSRLISASNDGTVRVWNPDKEVGIRTLRRHRSTVWAVAWTPDGTRFVSAGEDKAVQVCDANTGTPLLSLRGHDSPVHCVAVSPDGMLIASGCDGGDVMVWDATTGSQRFPLRGHQKSVYALAFDLGGQHLASQDLSGTVKIWNVADGREIASLPGRSPELPHRSLAFLPTGTRLVRGAVNVIEILDLATGKSVMNLRGQSGAMDSVAVSPDGRRIASGGSDNTVRIWDVQTGEELHTLYGHIGRVHSVAFSADGRRIVSGGEDLTIKVWDASTGEEVITLHGTGSITRSVAFNPQGTRIASSHGDGCVRIWEASPSIRQSVKPRDSKTGELVAWWTFDETEGDLVKDSSGHGLDGVVRGSPQRVPGRVGGALFFDGTDDYIDCGSKPAFDITGSITIAAWIRASTSSGPYAPIVAKGNTAWRLHWHLDSNSLELNVANIRWAPSLVAQAESPIDDGRWHHVAATYDSRQINLYVDGTLRTSRATRPLDEMGTNDSPVHIGGTTDDMKRKWHGEIDDVRIYNYALTADEVEKLYREAGPKTDQN
jgi:eukaryotic-like serine/threonine-protein kinase